MPTSMSGTFLHILKNAGPLGLYSGLSASLLRQLTVTPPIPSPTPSPTPLTNPPPPQ